VLVGQHGPDTLISLSWRISSTAPWHILHHRWTQSANSALTLSNWDIGSMPHLSSQPRLKLQYPSWEVTGHLYVLEGNGVWLNRRKLGEEPSGSLQFNVASLIFN
jgi:hypothetical protein